ncbi:hypothetical protein O6H91_06G130400 [Diphasiastrum complanatum]|uniref:Uncharacterized protein n=1 Tax=Diphasiastrum complanatum TaxID=34168 RepID=A0ACC2DJ57_DIPCM|nr:hypothetical protein O6H91_06G130400 [Diphasiastrum complanatum]
MMLCKWILVLMFFILEKQVMDLENKFFASAYKLGTLRGQKKLKPEESSKKKKKEKEEEESNEEEADSGGDLNKKETKKKEVTDPDWEWPAYDEWYSRINLNRERKLRTTSDKEESKQIPFEVVYERQEGWPDKVWVTLFSSYLIGIVKDCLPFNKQVFLEKPRIKGEELFLAIDKLRNYQLPETGDKAARLHLSHLMRFLEMEYKDTLVHYERMQREGTTSWEMLWAFLTPGQKVLYHCNMSGEQVCAIVHGLWYHKDMTGKNLHVELDVMDYNGQSYRKCMIERTIPEFKNERPFTSLPVRPMRFVEQRERMESVFLANGHKFYKLSTQPHCFMQFEGSLLRLDFIPGTNCRQILKHKADGRVMIDLWSFARMNPGYPMNYARPPTSCETCISTDEPEDEGLMLAPAIVYGFSFSLKQWGCFQVTGFSEISFDDYAFERHLVIKNEAQKNMILGLVTQYIGGPEPANSISATTNRTQQIDFISNKGEGCIFLCYGPPGTGKTLTAESVAEKLHRPLWSVSASELGSTPGDLESKLLQILDIASSWRAVLLLDEADIYLEQRASGGDPLRTTMTGIFLRLLEYYRGVLFLTTNRVMAFDDAFCSRISMFLRYHPLSSAERAKVWGNFLGRAGLTIDCDELGRFCEHELNGRDIRNCIRTAHTWAKSCCEQLSSTHVLKVVEMVEGFRDDLENALHDETHKEPRFSSILSKLQNGTHHPAQQLQLDGDAAGNGTNCG